MKIFQILLVVVLVLLWGLHTAPSFALLDTLKDKVITLDSSVESKAQLKTDLIALKKARPELHIDAQIPGYLNQDEVIMDLIDMAHKSNFSFKDLHFSLGTNSDLDLPQMMTELVVEGPRNQFKNFLTFLEVNKRFLGTDHMNLQIFEERGRTMIRSSLSIYAFFTDRSLLP